MIFRVHETRFKLYFHARKIITRDLIIFLSRRHNNETFAIWTVRIICRWAPSVILFVTIRAKIVFGYSLKARDQPERIIMVRTMCIQNITYICLQSRSSSRFYFYGDEV